VNTSYELYCRNQSHGRFRRLADALAVAVEIAGHSWRDLAVWRGTELVAIVQAGGEVVELVPGTVETAQQTDRHTPAAA